MAQYSIKDIEMMTGIKAHTLRIWEQRYNIPLPKRTSTNIRYYDDEDLRLLLNISLLNLHGHKISEITRFSDKEIRDLAINYSIRSEKHEVHIQSLMSTMINLDEQSFEKILSTSILQYGLPRTITEVIFPFMNMLGVMWMTGTVNPAYEHFITNLVRQKLIVAIDGQVNTVSNKKKKCLLFLPEGESHEIGLLFANYMLRAAGHHTLYLGQNLPISDLQRVKEKYNPDIVFTSLTTGFPLLVAKGMISELNSFFPDSTILLTGRYFVDKLQELEGNVHYIQSIEDLKVFL
ncbi:MAG: MerR family transcriptional regulator [Bacteroidetes bacterium]|nr:MerR family transcriptional regulator [Bacteroidota bacterium]MBL0065154.1 MerR family transcriptional regulator [Bacteroidota bacterium]